LSLWKDPFSEVWSAILDGLMINGLCTDNGFYRLREFFLSCISPVELATRIATDSIGSLPAQLAYSWLPKADKVWFLI
jgi:hypothetical protein